MMGWGFHWFGFLWMLLWWAALIGLGAWLVSVLGRRSHDGGAREILDQRFARGELTREEYTAMKAELGRRS